MLTKKDKSFIEKIRHKAGKAINTYNLIDENDTILVGVSGGKDSLALLDILYSRLKYIPIKYTIKAQHIVVKNLYNNLHVDNIKAFCEKREIELIIKEIDIDFTQKQDKTECFICSWHRRTLLFKDVEENACNKLALGHHMDDAIETLFMNMTYHAEISSMAPKVKMRKGNFDIIRPLILITDQELIQYSKLLEFNINPKKCPFEDNNNREKFRAIIDEMSGLHKNARYNLFRSMNNIIEEYLP